VRVIVKITPERIHGVRLASTIKDVARTKARAFTIRPATNDDVKAIVGIYNWAVTRPSPRSTRSR